MKSECKGCDNPEAVLALLPRKASEGGQWCPYRKPTQVGEASSLRGSGESS